MFCCRATCHIWRGEKSDRAARNQFLAESHGFVQRVSPANVSNRTLRPSTQPSFYESPSECGDVGLRFPSLSADPISTPIRRTRSGCCARAASGHVAAAPPISVMNSRRCMSTPSSGDSIVSAQTSTLIGAETGIKTIAAVHSQCLLWVISGQTTPGQKRPDVRYTRNSDQKYCSAANAAKCQADSCTAT